MRKNHTKIRDYTVLDREAPRIAIEQDVTLRQARYVAARVHLDPPAHSEAEGVLIAGYAARDTTTPKKSPKVQRALAAELARKAEIAEKAAQLKQALAENPRDAITSKLAEHAEDATIAPNQTRAVELLAKISGVMVERVEIDPGEFLRSRLGAKLYGEENG